MGVYKKDKSGNRWRVVIYLGDGKRSDWIVEGTKKEADAFEARKRVELEIGVLSEHRTSPTLTDFFTHHYGPHAEARLKARTWTNRKYSLRVITKQLGSEKLVNLKRDVVEKYQNFRLSQSIRPSTINDEMKMLRTIMNYALSIGVPCIKPDFPDLPVRGKRKVKAWTDEQVATFLAAVQAESPALLAIVLFMLNTGCRKGEALAMEWSGIDLKQKLIRIEPNEEWQPKDDEAREVPISDHLYTLLDSLPRKSKKWVFPSGDGDRYAFWPQLAFDRARKAAGLKGGPHTTRHTFATHFLRRQPDLFLLARILGHSDITVTKLYAHLLPDHLERARNVVNFATPELR